MIAREQLAILSGALTLLCVVPYLRDVVRGTTLPQRASWFVFASVSTVAAGAQLAAGADAGAWLAAGSAIGFSAVFVASLWRGAGGGQGVDRLVIAVAGAGLFGSIVTGEALVAVAAVVIAEIAAVALTVRKAIADPSSETTSTWVIDAIAGALAIVAAGRFSLTELLYPVHHTTANAAVVAAIVVGRHAGVSLRVAP